MSCMQEVCAKAAALLADGQAWDGAAEHALGRLLGLLARWLFLENSRPVHRALRLAAVGVARQLQRLPPRRFGLFRDALIQQVAA